MKRNYISLKAQNSSSYSLPSVTYNNVNEIHLINIQCTENSGMLHYVTFDNLTIEYYTIVNNKLFNAVPFTLSLNNNFKRIHLVTYDSIQHRPINKINVKFFDSNGDSILQLPSPVILTFCIVTKPILYNETNNINLMSSGLVDDRTFLRKNFKK